MPSLDTQVPIISKEIAEIRVNNGNEKEQLVTLSDPITLRGLKSDYGNVFIDGAKYVSDVIKEKNGVIGVERNVIKEKLLTSYYSQYEDGHKIGVSIPSDKYKDCNLLCDYFKKGNIETDDECFTYSFAASWLSLKSAKFNSKSDYEKFITYHDVHFYFALKVPTFEPLSEHDQQAIKALKSYYPNTIVDTGAHTEITYIADTKLYIDKKLNELNAKFLKINSEIGG